MRTNTQNARQLLSGIHVSNGTTVAVGLAYDHDANGRITDMDDTYSGGLQRGYQYDLLGRLVSSWCDWGASSYSYDALGNMRGYVIDDYRHARHLTLDYHYDARNRLIHFVNERGGSFDQAYDSYGRITTGHNRLTQYDHSHRPTSVTHNGGRQYDFVFDGNLHRARETIAEVTSYSVYSAGTLLLRDNITDGEQTDYVRLGRHTIARLKTDSAGVTTVTYPHTNHLGSPVAATDATGDLLWREEYTPFGRKHENAPGQRGEEGFTGHIFDGQNTVHMKARTYMTTSYRFTTPDPVTFLSSGLDPAYFNRYAYVGNDPVNAIDPTGMDTVYCTTNDDLLNCSIRRNDDPDSITVDGVTRDLGEDANLEFDQWVNLLTTLAGNLGVNKLKVAEYRFSDEIVNAVFDVVGAIPTPGTKAGTAVARGATVGRRGNPSNARGNNRSTNIGGRRYSGHALDRMQESGMTPSVVEHTISTGRRSSGNRPGRTRYTTDEASVVIDDATGTVITANPN